MLIEILNSTAVKINYNTSELDVYNMLVNMYSDVHLPKYYHITVYAQITDSYLKASAPLKHLSAPENDLLGHSLR